MIVINDFSVFKDVVKSTELLLPLLSSKNSVQCFVMMETITKFIENWHFPLNGCIERKKKKSLLIDSFFNLASDPLLTSCLYIFLWF